jgi:hypothetical protein
LIFEIEAMWINVNLLLLGTNTLRVDVKMRVEVAPTHPGVLEGNDGPVGQLLRTGRVVESVPLEGRLEERAEVAVTVAAVI